MTRVPILPARGSLRLVCVLFVLEILSQALWTNLSLGDLDLFKKKILMWSIYSRNPYIFARCAFRPRVSHTGTLIQQKQVVRHLTSTPATLLVLTKKQ